MNFLLILLFSIQCFYLLFWGLKNSIRVYEYPFIVGLVLIGIFLLQIIGLINSGKIEAEVLTTLLIMVNLCTLAVFLGYKMGKKPFRVMNWKFDNSRLLISSFVLSLLGGTFFILYSRLPITYITGLVSGIAVVYNFFGSTLFYGFVIALIIFIKTKSKIAFIIVIVDSLIFFDRIFIIGRRVEAFEFIFAILLILWFEKKIILGQKWIIGVFLLGLILLYSTADYRRITLEANVIYWEDILKMPVIDNFDYILKNGGAEVEAAAYEMAGTSSKMDLDFGTSLWNRMVFTYVPAYLFGYRYKESLMIKLNVDAGFNEYRFIKAASTAKTGFTDAFQSFWYFGFINFFIIAYILARIYKTALVGNLVYRIFYIILMGDAILVITHSTSFFLIPWVHISIFLMPLLIFSKKKPTS